MVSRSGGDGRDSEGAVLCACVRYVERVAVIFYLPEINSVNGLVGGVGRGCSRALTTHTLQKDTTPSSWRQGERAQEGRGQGEHNHRRQNAGQHHVKTLERHVHG